MLDFVLCDSCNNGCEDNSGNLKTSVSSAESTEPAAAAITLVVKWWNSSHVIAALRSPDYSHCSFEKLTLWADLGTSLCQKTFQNDDTKGLFFLKDFRIFPSVKLCKFSRSTKNLVGDKLKRCYRQWKIYLYLQTYDRSLLVVLVCKADYEHFKNSTNGKIIYIDSAAERGTVYHNTCIPSQYHMYVNGREKCVT